MIFKALTLNILFRRISHNHNSIGILVFDHVCVYYFGRSFLFIFVFSLLLSLFGNLYEFVIRHITLCTNNYRTNTQPVYKNIIMIIIAVCSIVILNGSFFSGICESSRKRNKTFITFSLLIASNWIKLELSRNRKKWTFSWSTCHVYTHTVRNWTRIYFNKRRKKQNFNSLISNRHNCRNIQPSVKPNRMAWILKVSIFVVFFSIRYGSKIFYLSFFFLICITFEMHFYIFKLHRKPQSHKRRRREKKIVRKPKQIIISIAHLFLLLLIIKLFIGGFRCTYTPYGSICFDEYLILDYIVAR